MNNVTLLHGDCLDLLPTLDAASVDLILADLPYGTTACKWDSVLPLDVLWREYRRVLTPRGAVVLTASQPFTSTLVQSNPRWFRYSWIWEKSTGTGFLNVKRQPIKCHEDVLVFYRQTPTYNPQMQPAKLRKVNRGGTLALYDTKRVTTDNGCLAYPRSVLYFPKELGTQHPTQKPVALGAYLVRTHSNPGDVVLDNTMGSGSFGVAAVQEGRAFIGIEQDADYYRVACERIAAVDPLFQEVAS